MKKLIFFFMLFMIMSCVAVKEVEEEQLRVSRRYVGDFIEYRQTGPADGNGPNIIWIKTTLQNNYGRISAYGKKCEFFPGERLYLRRELFSPGMVSSYWEYYIENDSGLTYQATELQHDKKTEIETWFR